MVVEPGKLRILVVNAISSAQFDDVRRNTFLRHASDGTTVDVVSLRSGNKTVDHLSLELVNSVEILGLLSGTNLAAYHGVLINCFFDPALDEARECFALPILGAGQLGMTVASLLVREVVVFSPTVKMIPRIRRAIHEYGLERSVAGIVPIQTGVEALQKLQLTGEVEPALGEELSRCDKKALALGGEIGVFACTATLGLTPLLQRHFSFPLVDAGLVAFKVVEAIAALYRDTGLTHSRLVTYAPPSELPTVLARLRGPSYRCGRTEKDQESDQRTGIPGVRDR
ncbi:MAG: aspartate/glutamate racemase family protein [Firmicutes bacterium]|jgi:Asp/Glu/hydantoin racemase|nr:aspartate/glutamate racemase family protein [Bacillota bacterium]